jgi:hypothetical protein
VCNLLRVLKQRGEDSCVLLNGDRIIASVRRDDQAQASAFLFRLESLLLVIGLKAETKLTDSVLFRLLISGS